MHSLSTTAATSRATGGVSMMMQVVGALMLGAVIVYGAGFANTAAVHNAAHDMRHVAGFPCH